MPRKRKGELPSGNIRRKVYIGSEPKLDASGKPIIENGKIVMQKKYQSITASTPQEADFLVAQLKANINKNVADNTMTLRDGINKHIESIRAVRSVKTIEGYETIRDYAFLTIIDKPMHKLTNDMLQEAINMECKRKSTSSKSLGKTVSAKTVCNEWGLIATVLKKYRKNQPFSVVLPQHKSTVNELSSPETIYNLFKGTDIELPVMLAMWLSFTMSEIRGLTKSKSIKGDYIYIEEVTVKAKQGDVTKKIAKNTVRNRMHRIPPYIKELIDKVETDVLVPMSANTIAHRFTRTLEKNGLPHMTFHDLRHVSASVMLFLNVPDKYAMERGGWSSDKVMKNTYMQVYDTERVKVDNKIDEYFGNIIEPKNDNKKYEAYLTLFDKTDCPKSRKEFLDFVKYSTKDSMK